MLKDFAAPQHRRVTLIFLAVFCVATIAALAVGLDGNTIANVLALAAAFALVLAFVHPWRSAREFMYLYCASVFGFIVFAVLHNLFAAAAGATENVWVLPAILQFLSVLTFLAAIFVCPPALVIGLGGALIVWFAGRKGGQPEPPV